MWSGHEFKFACVNLEGNETDVIDGCTWAQFFQVEKVSHLRNKMIATRLLKYVLSPLHGSESLTHLPRPEGQRAHGSAARADAGPAD